MDFDINDSIRRVGAKGAEWGVKAGIPAAYFGIVAKYGQDIIDASCKLPEGFDNWADVTKFGTYLEPVIDFLGKSSIYGIEASLMIGATLASGLGAWKLGERIKERLK